jgi:hypothetical protein
VNEALKTYVNQILHKKKRGEYSNISFGKNSAGVKINLD